MGTSAERSSCNTEYYKRGDVLPGLWIDGMDVLAVKEGMRFAIDYVLKNGPIVIEAATYRYSGHSMSDPGTSYRSRDEIQEVRQKRDPITSFKDRIVETGLATADDIKKIDAEVKKEVDAATAAAKADSEIGVPELTCDIYSMNQEGDVRGLTPDVKLKHITLKKAVNL
jgi:pyruvate dehydrogenase E1 component alpha subunit